MGKYQVMSFQNLDLIFAWIPILLRAVLTLSSPQSQSLKIIDNLKRTNPAKLLQGHTKDDESITFGKKIFQLLDISVSQSSPE